MADDRRVSPMRGVVCKYVNGSWYWYARLSNRLECFGAGEEGLEKAVAAKSKENQDKAVAKLQGAGIRIQTTEFRTFKMLSNWYMQLPEVQRLGSYTRKVQAAAHLMAYFGKMKLARLDADEIERYRQIRQSQKAASRTADLEVENLRAMFNKAVERKKIPVELMPGQFPMENGHVPRRTVTEDEYKLLLKEADPKFRDVIICAYESAMRSTEVCELRASKIILDEPRIVMGSNGIRETVMASYIDLGIFDTKTGARRTIPISDELRKVFERRLQGLEPTDHVFTTRTGRFYTKHQVAARFKNVCKRAKVVHGDKIEIDPDGKPLRPGITFHCLRHSRVTIWIEMGYSDEIVRRASGHKTLEAYRRYAKPDPGKVMVLVQSQKPDKNRIIEKEVEKLSSLTA